MLADVAAHELAALRSLELPLNFLLDKPSIRSWPVQPKWKEGQGMKSKTKIKAGKKAM